MFGLVFFPLLDTRGGVGTGASGDSLHVEILRLLGLTSLTAANALCFPTMTRLKQKDSVHMWKVATREKKSWRWMVGGGHVGAETAVERSGGHLTDT